MTRKSFLTLTIGVAAAMLYANPSAAQGIAYGSINNFDAVNDTGVPCHGFEIEIEDIRSRDITYTYDWNHYGVPIIKEDNSDPLHPRVFVRYESKKNPDGTWAAYTAVPAGPISPTDGHRFTDPSVNFGGEHFGVGFYGTPRSVKYNWLVDDGFGNLIHGGPVYISTPAFTYYPPINAAPAQVQAVIVPPPPPAPPVLEFGEPMWVKETRTETHNNNKVELRDLVPDDPDDPNDRNWANGEPEEVEVEWQLLQTDYNSDNGGPNGELEGAPEDLPNGDEVITRRYDFFKYIGPSDEESGEAKADKVGPDDVHGVGIKIINGATVDLSTVVVVGDYIGAQMAGFDAAGQLGLIDHLQDGEINVPYVDRTMVIGGTPPIITTRTGPLPDGMEFDEVSGVLSGTPFAAGTFTFTLHTADANLGDVTTTYHFTILDEGIVEPLHITVTTMAAPPEGGTVYGAGEYIIGTTVTVMAVPNPDYEFVNWTEGGTVVSASPIYEFTDDLNRELIANFILSLPPPTPTDTPIQTETPTETPIPLDTPTLTNTPTDTPTLTNTPTDTPSLTNTPTDIPSPTNTPSGCGLVGDLNQDGKVGIEDLLIVSNSYRSSVGDPRYNPLADVDGDGDVDIFDLVRVAVHYRETCTKAVIPTGSGPGLKQSSSSPTIELIPSETAPNVGSVIELAVQIVDADDIIGVEYNLYYTSSNLQFLEPSGVSDFLGSGQVGVFVVPPKTDVEGVAQIAAARLSSVGASGSGVMQRLRFGVVGAGPCMVGIGEVQLLTSHFEAVDGESVGEVILVPTLDVVRNGRMDAEDLATVLANVRNEKSLDRMRILLECAFYWMQQQ